MSTTPAPKQKYTFSVNFHEAGDDPIGRITSAIQRFSPTNFLRKARFAHVSITLNEVTLSLNWDGIDLYEDVQGMIDEGSGPITSLTREVPAVLALVLNDKFAELADSDTRLSLRRCFWAWLGLRVPGRRDTITICTDVVAFLLAPDEIELMSLTPDQLYDNLK